MDSFTKSDNASECECNFSLVATLSTGILAYSELFIPFLHTFPEEERFVCSKYRI